MPLPWDSHKRAEVQPLLVQIRGIPWHDHRHDLRPSLAHQSLDTKIPHCSKEFLVTTETPSTAVAGVVGTHVIAGEVGSPGKTPDTLTPVASEVQLVHRKRSPTPPRSPVPASGQGHLLVDGKEPPPRGMPFGGRTRTHARTQVAKKIICKWGSPTIDLFATHLNEKFPLYCSPIPDPQAVFEDAFRHPWKDLDVYAFPPFHLVERVVARVRETPNLSMTLVAPLWPEKTWFADLLLLLTQPPLELPPWDHLLRQPHFNRFHRGTHALNLHAWRLSSDSSESQDFRDELLASCPVASESPLHACTSHNGSLSVVGVREGALLRSMPLYL